MDAALAQKCLTDHVAALALLVPWQDGAHPSPLAVCSAWLAEGQQEAGLDAVRGAQAAYLATRVERFNADFGAPVGEGRLTPIGGLPEKEGYKDDWILEHLSK